MLMKFFKSDKLGLLVALLIIVLVFQALTGGKYLSQANLINIMIAMAVVGLVTIGESFLLITGKVDLSPGSVAAFSGVFAAILLNYGLSMYLVIPIVLLLGMGIGALNALLVNKLKLEAFIATLATMSVFSPEWPTSSAAGKAIFLTDKSFLTFGAGRVASIPITRDYLCNHLRVFHCDTVPHPVWAQCVHDWRQPRSIAADRYQQRKNAAQTVYDDLGARGAGRVHHGRLACPPDSR